MIIVDTLNLSDIRMRFWRDFFDAGYGPNVLEGNASSPSPPGPGPSGNGLVWGAGDYLIWDTGNYLVWGP